MYWYVTHIVNGSKHLGTFKIDAPTANDALITALENRQVVLVDGSEIRVGLKDTMPTQAILGLVSGEDRKQRAAEQMTLGELIEELEKLGGDREIVGISDPDSYRGYYADLAFHPNEIPIKVSDLLEACKWALNRYFGGYKGGEFFMDKDTPLWVSPWGEASGMKLIGWTRA